MADLGLILYHYCILLLLLPISDRLTSHGLVLEIEFLADPQDERYRIIAVSLDHTIARLFCRILYRTHSFNSCMMTTSFDSAGAAFISKAEVEAYFRTQCSLIVLCRNIAINSSTLFKSPIALHGLSRRTRDYPYCTSVAH